MPSLRELLPGLLGGAAGALGGERAARGIQSAAAWSHKLREDETANERRDKIEAQTARRLEMAEAAEKRQIEGHKQRITAGDLSLKQANKEAAQYDKDQRAINSVREIFGERIAAVGGDPNIVGGMSVREMMAFEDELKKEESRFDSIGAAQEHFAQNPLGTGEGAQVYTDEGTFSSYGPRQPSPRSNEEFDGSMVDSKTRTLETKANGKIADAQDEIEQARRDMDTYGREEDEYKTAERTIRVQERKIQEIRTNLDEDVVQMMIKSNVPNSRINEFRHRNDPDPRAPALQTGHANTNQLTGRGLFNTMIAENQERNPAVIDF